MKIIKQSHVTETLFDGPSVMSHLERCGRTCYKSEHKIGVDSADKFLAMIIKRGHETVLEHFSFTVRFITDRGVTHCLVRHRIASFSQESTQYCNYTKDRFGDHLFFIQPHAIEEDLSGVTESGEYDGDSEAVMEWLCACGDAESSYRTLIEKGWKAQEARSILPTCLKTEIVITANLREWRHILKLRTSLADQLQVQDLMKPLLSEMQEKLPIIFGDL